MTEKTHKMKTHTKIALGSIGALVLVGGMIFAGGHVMASGWKHGGHGMHKMRMFERVDANGDGTVTKEEMSAFRKDTMSRHDTDGSATINLAEFEGIWLEHMRPMMVDRFQMVDEDGDGEITNVEVDAKLFRMMHWMDKNGDGAVSLDEIMHGKRYHDDDDRDDDRDDDKS